MPPHHPIRKAGRGEGETTAGPPRATATAAADIPDKLYFRIGEVARLCAVPAYVLRFWETEFPQLRPNKGGTGQRLFRRRDVEMALRIKRLLYDQGYTIPGARQLLKSESRHKEAQLPLVTHEPHLGPKQLQQLHSLQDDLRSLLTLLQHPPGAAPPISRPSRADLFLPDPELAARTIARRNKVSPRRSPLRAATPAVTDRLFDFPSPDHGPAAAPPRSHAAPEPEPDPRRPPQARSKPS